MSPCYNDVLSQCVLKKWYKLVLAVFYYVMSFTIIMTITMYSVKKKLKPKMTYLCPTLKQNGDTKLNTAG